MLNLQKLSKGMNLNDKMKLLFEDTNHTAVSQDNESLLTPQERDSIIEDARRNGELREIRRVNELYILSNYIAIDIELSQFSLLLSLSYLEKILMGIILKGAADEMIGEILYDLAKKDEISGEETIDKKMEELRMKYKVDSVLFKGFDFFNALNEENQEKVEPNNKIQQAFMVSFRHAKILKKKLFDMEYVLKKSPIDFLPKRNKEIIQQSEELLTLFINLDSSLKPLRIYRDFGNKIVGEVQITDPEFLKTVKDIGKALELSEQEKEQLQFQIDKHLGKDL